VLAAGEAHPVNAFTHACTWIPWRRPSATATSSGVVRRRAVAEGCPQSATAHGSSAER
jgi:hypothetical protein